MRKLIDTSVWIDYFSPRGKRSLPVLDALAPWITDDEVVTILPIFAELNSGVIQPRLSRLFQEIRRIDPDWNDPSLWEEVARHGKRFAGLSIVDRMILTAASREDCQVITFDQRLAKAAQALGLGLK